MQLAHHAFLFRFSGCLKNIFCHYIMFCHYGGLGNPPYDQAYGLAVGWKPTLQSFLHCRFSDRLPD
ncbi:MAG: hypothetical protein IJV35_10020 [Neisseriaceae bacterium]|nr:hypothetical protein [Neisseriaceae bacterium]